MTVAVALRQDRLPISQPQTDAPNGLRHWTPAEYRRMAEMDIFDGARVELLGGDIWQVHASDYYRWTPEQYHRLIESSFFDDGRVELLEGLIWDMASQLTLHTTGVRLTQIALEEVFEGQFEVRVQMAITLPNGMEPEPDIAIAPGTPLDYIQQHPGRDELLLVVEVSDSTLAKDRGSKLLAYAQALIAEYWIVNLVDHHLEVHRNPVSSGVYADSTVYLPGQVVAPLSMPTKTIDASDLLPPVQQL